MNNRYLYRAKRTDNGEWVEGFLMDDNYINVPFNDNDVGGRFDDPVEIDPSTICQYSSISDKNDESVFENHIVRDDDGRVGIIKFGRNDLHVGFYLEWVSEKAMYYRKELGFWASKAEVIGNIFDNPELLEASNG